MISNIKIRREAKANGIPLWVIAKRLEISEASMSRLMREELSEEMKNNILNIISEIAKEDDHNV